MFLERVRTNFKTEQVKRAEELANATRRADFLLKQYEALVAELNTLVDARVMVLQPEPCRPEMSRVFKFAAHIEGLYKPESDNHSIFIQLPNSNIWLSAKDDGRFKLQQRFLSKGPEKDLADSITIGDMQLILLVLADRMAPFVVDMGEMPEEPESQAILPD